MTKEEERSVEQYLDININELIEAFPALGKILDDAGIGCGSCALGTCPLKDIVSIHNLDDDAAERLLRQISAVLLPGQEVVIPELPRAKDGRVVTGSVSPPIRALVEEHVVIKKVLAVVPDIVSSYSGKSAADRALLEECVAFIRNFADRYHHAKEEEILFSYFDSRQAIIATMNAEHVSGRKYVFGVVEGMKRGDDAAVKYGLLQYRKLLIDHIHKEDSILYPWMDRQLTDHQVGTLFSEFAIVDEKLRPDADRFREWAARLTR